MRRSCTSIPAFSPHFRSAAGLTDTIIRAEGLNLGDEPKATAIAGAKAQITSLAACPRSDALPVAEPLELHRHE